jgi:hypothetical protein
MKVKKAIEINQTVVQIDVVPILLNGTSEIIRQTVIIDTRKSMMNPGMETALRRYEGRVIVIRSRWTFYVIKIALTTNLKVVTGAISRTTNLIGVPNQLPFLSKIIQIMIIGLFTTTDVIQLEIQIPMANKVVILKIMTETRIITTGITPIVMFLEPRLSNQYDNQQIRLKYIQAGHQ